MACYKPVLCWKLPEDGTLISFTPQRPPYEHLRIACGKCTGCRADQSLMWSVRAYHESTEHFKNSFITLTYDDENLPHDGKIVKRDLQLFFKKLRKQLSPQKIRYIACGEYGEQTHRPHYHAIIFGEDFRQGKVDINHQLYTNEALSQIWGKGVISIAPVTMSSICYVCGYVYKKIADKDTFSLMSRRPGIGHNWLDKYKSDLLRTGSVTIEGREYPIPKRYLDWEKEYLDPAIIQRKEYAVANAHKATDRALDNKALARQSQLNQKKERI